MAIPPANPPPYDGGLAGEDSRGVLLDDLARDAALEDELVTVRVDGHGVALAELVLEQLQGERILDQPLDRSLQRARAERGIVPLAGEYGLGGVGDLEFDP